MLKKFIEKKYSEIISQIPDDIMEFPFYKVINEILDNSIVQTFLKAELDWWIYEDRIFRSLNYSFNFSKIENSKINDKIDEIYRENAIITKDELHELIKKSILLHTNFMILPSKTLMIFVFTNSPQISREELILKLNFFGGYDFLIDALKSKFKKDIITRVEFEKVLKEVLKEYFANANKDELVSLFNSINDFFGFEPQEIHIKIIEKLFPQIGLENLLLGIQNQIQDDVEILRIDELLKFITSDISKEFTITAKPTATTQIPEANSDKVNDEQIDYTVKIDKSLDKLMTFYDEKSKSDNVKETYSSIQHNEVINSNDTPVKDNEKNIDDILNKNEDDELSSEDIDALFNQ